MRMSGRCNGYYIIYLFFVGKCSTIPPRDTRPLFRYTRSIITQKNHLSAYLLLELTRVKLIVMHKGLTLYANRAEVDVTPG